MAARGAEAKKIVTSKIIDTFKDSFLYNDGKEIRIPIEENGEIIQIKVTLTAAKVNVTSDDLNFPPVSVSVANNSKFSAPAAETNVSDVPFELTDEEKKNVKELLESLNMY